MHPFATRLTTAHWASALALGLLLLSVPVSAGDPAFSVLVFSKTSGFRHDSIPVGAEALKKVGEANGFSVVASEDDGLFTADGLKPFQVIVFLSVTGNKNFTDPEKEAFKIWYEAGHGWVGIHAASNIQVVDNTHQSTAHLPAVWERKDEWYAFKEQPKDVHVLLKIDETSYKPDKGGMDGNHPMAWWHLYDGGRAFYTELGHTKESFADPLYLKHVAGAILWAANKPDAPK